MNNGHTNYDENLFQLPSRASLYLIQLALSNVFPPESSPYWVTAAIDYSGVSKALKSVFLAIIKNAMEVLWQSNRYTFTKE